jgi:hypothetical protein
MLYYETFLSSGIEDNHAQPPPQRYNIFYISTKLFLNFFFPKWETLCICGERDLSISKPPITFRELGLPPTNKMLSMEKQLWLCLNALTRNTTTAVASTRPEQVIKLFYFSLSYFRESYQNLLNILILTLNN